MAICIMCILMLSANKNSVVAYIFNYSATLSAIIWKILLLLHSQRQTEARQNVAYNFIGSTGCTARDSYLQRLWKRQRVHGGCMQNLWGTFETSQSKYTDYNLWHQSIVWFLGSGMLFHCSLVCSGKVSSNSLAVNIRVFNLFNPCFTT